MDQDRKLKTALDESRLLILGAQVLFGFLFQAVFRTSSGTFLPPVRPRNAPGLEFMLLSICLLIAPSLYHQIIFAREPARRRNLRLPARPRRHSASHPGPRGFGVRLFEHLFGRTRGCGNAGCLYGTILGSNRCIGGSRMAGVF
jgi:hypothetical protein